MLIPVRKNGIDERDCKMEKFCKLLFSLTIFALVLTACARPPTTTVGQGADPFHVDKDVVFRTTYYFRVFDYCEKMNSNDSEDLIIPLRDSLYRFRMTGKSKSILSNVKFEAGTVKAWEIDPFGAKIEFDEDSKRYRVISPEEVEREAMQAANLKKFRDVQRLLLDYRKEFETMFHEQLKSNDAAAVNLLKGIDDAIIDLLKGMDNAIIDGFAASTPRRQLMPADEDEMLKYIKAVIKLALPKIFSDLREEDVEKIVEIGFKDVELANIESVQNDYLKQAIVQSIENFVTKSDDKDIKDILQASKDFESEINEKTSPVLSKIIDLFISVDQNFSSSALCEEDAPIQRGFQIMGPEGWRTFKQDERLILAMSSSTQPLVSTLKELSNRRINDAENQRDSERLLVTNNRKIVAEAIHELSLQNINLGSDLKFITTKICKLLVKDQAQIDELCGNADST